MHIYIYTYICMYVHIRDFSVGEGLEGSGRGCAESELFRHTCKGLGDVRMLLLVLRSLICFELLAGAVWVTSGGFRIWGCSGLGTCSVGIQVLGLRAWECRHFGFRLQGTL